MSILDNLSRVSTPSYAEPSLKAGQCFTHSKECVCGYRADNVAGIDLHLRKMQSMGINGHTRIGVTCRICHPVEQLEADEPEAVVFTCLCGECFAYIGNLMAHIQSAQTIELGKYVHGFTQFREPSDNRKARVLANLKG